MPGCALIKVEEDQPSRGPDLFGALKERLGNP